MKRLIFIVCIILIAVQSVSATDLKDKYVAWRIAGAGYPWNLTSGVNFRYGFCDFLGVGAYLDLGADFTHVSVDYTRLKSDGRIDNEGTNEMTSCYFHYSGGVKFYPYRGLFIDCGFTSKSPAYQRVSATYYYGKLVECEKTINGAIGQSNAVMFGVGYDLVATEYGDVGFYMGVSVGAMYDINSKKFSPTASLRIGVAWPYD